jgi:hypothetical protein
MYTLGESISLSRGCALLKNVCGQTEAAGLGTGTTEIGVVPEK